MKIIGISMVTYCLLYLRNKLGQGPEERMRVFNKCKACHAVVAGKTKWDSLHGFFGRQPGTAPKYRFSKGMKKFGRQKMDEGVVPCIHRKA